MRVRPSTLHSTCRRPRLRLPLPLPLPPPLPTQPRPRFLLTLAIETSCDDTSVAVLEVDEYRVSPRTAAQLHFHKKVTANNTAFNGVHPLVALESHQENLAKLVAEAIEHLPWDASRDQVRLPEFIAVTRGPGMRSNLFTGLDTAKGLAVAWQKPLLGVHHMQAHALTPRLVDALGFHQHLAHMKQGSERHLREDNPHILVDPDFPFLSILASGGHTLLINSASLTDHEIMGSTADIAIGECLDKMARAVLPSDVLQTAGNTMYGALLETFTFPPKDRAASAQDNKPTYDSSQDKSTASEYVDRYKSKYTYKVPKNNEEALKRNVSSWGWRLKQPMARAAGGLKNKSMEMSFTGLTTAVERIIRYQRDPATTKLTEHERSPENITTEERKDLAEDAMRTAFEHLAGRVLLGLQQCHAPTIVMAGGVAANSYLRYILASTLCAHGYGHVKVVFPPPSLCSDNAAMIAWAGVEMFLHGIRSPLSIRAVRKWPLDQLLSPLTEATPQPPISKRPSS